jgi:hypothetical protein
MAHITYKIVQHDGGWAYTVDGVFSEAFQHATGAFTPPRAAGTARAGTYRGDRIRDRRRQWHTETAASIVRDR